MGWGIALDGASPPPRLRYADAPPADFSQQDFWRWVQAFAGWDLVAGTGNPLANSYGMAQGRQAAGSGLPAYHDIARSRRGLPLSFTVQARLAPNGVPETARPGNPYARTIMASSTAQTARARAGHVLARRAHGVALRGVAQVARGSASAASQSLRNDC